MKKFIFILTQILALTQVSYGNGQDTLVKKNGMVIPAFISESDSTMIAFSTTDSSAQELNVIQRTDLLFIKHRDGKTEQFFRNDTIITMGGIFMIGKVLEISQEAITVFSYSGKVNNIIMFTPEDIFMLRLSDGTSTLIDHAPQTMSDGDAYLKGVTDANKYFKPSAGAKAGSVLCGVGTYIYGAGLVGEFAIAAGEPKNIHNTANPNDQLLETNSAYRTGYLSVAGKKKKKACWGSYAGGVVLPIAATLVLAGVLLASY